MSRQLSDFRIFIASPRGLSEERQAFVDSISEYNNFEANTKEINFTPVGWKDTLPGVGRPQELINRDIESCDYCVLVLHDRWGMNPNREDGKYSSGTEEEYHIALECINSSEKPMRDIVVLFKHVDERQMADPGPELKKVLSFRKNIEETQTLLFDTYSDCTSFQAKIRKYLAHWCRTAIEAKNQRKKGTIETRIISHVDEVASKEHDMITFQLPREELLNRAENAADQGKILAAEEYFSHLIQDNTYAEGYIRYGRFLRHHGQPERAIYYLEKAIEIAGKQSDFPTIPDANRQIGKVHELNGDLTKAFDYLYKALDDYRKYGHLRGSGKTYCDIGKNFRKKGSMEEALASFDSALQIFRQLSDTEGIAKAIGHKGLVYKSCGDFDKARNCYEESLKLHQSINNDKAIPMVRSNLGVLYRLEGDYSRALSEHEIALEQHVKEDNKQGIAREYGNIAVVYRKMGELSKAEESHKKSLRISEDIGNIHGMAIQYGNLGFIARTQDKLDDALQYYQKSLKFSEQVGDRKGIAILFNNIGSIYAVMGNSLMAEKFLLDAKNIEEKMNSNYELTYTNLELGKLYSSMQKYTKAKEHLHLAKQTAIKYMQKDCVSEIDELLSDMLN